VAAWVDVVEEILKPEVNDNTKVNTKQEATLETVNTDETLTAIDPPETQAPEIKSEVKNELPNNKEQKQEQPAALEARKLPKTPENPKLSRAPTWGPTSRTYDNPRPTRMTRPPVHAPGVAETMPAKQNLEVKGGRADDASNGEKSSTPSGGRKSQKNRPRRGKGSARPWK
jgi:hypothetical protein